MLVFVFVCGDCLFEISSSLLFFFMHNIQLHNIVSPVLRAVPEMILYMCNFDNLDVGSVRRVFGFRSSKL